MFFVTPKSEFTAELTDVLYSPNLGYNLFSPNAEFDETWNRHGGPDKVLTAFDGNVTFENQNGICLLYTSPSPRDRQKSRMPSSA